MTTNAEDKLLIARAEDTVILCERQNCIKATGFLTPTEAEVIRRNLKKASVETVFCGGYPDAERRMFVALPDYLTAEDAMQLLSVIEITGRDIAELKHPDFLGSLLGLGIKREKLGDILTFDDKCLVFADENIADYIVKNLDKVGRKGVNVRCVQPDEIEIPLPRMDEISTTVSALRLDAVVAAAIKNSRNAAVEALRAGRVFVNWIQEDSPSFKIKPGDVFSVRGCGRFRLSEEVRETKKRRLGICIYKMI